MKSYLPLLIVLVLASAYGFWWKRKSGAIRSNKAIPGHRLSEQVLGQPLGSRATMVQFSSAFCTPCRATHALLSQMVQTMKDVKHIQVDAESHLELVRELDIRSTPTTVFINKDNIHDRCIDKNRCFKRCDFAGVLQKAESRKNFCARSLRISK